MLKRAQLSLDTSIGAWFVDLPSYHIQANSFLPIVAGLIAAAGIVPGADPKQVAAHNPTAVVELPDDTPLDARGQIDKDALAAMYHGTRFASPDYVPPVLSAP